MRKSSLAGAYPALFFKNYKRLYKHFLLQWYKTECLVSIKVQKVHLKLLCNSCQNDRYCWGSGEGRELCHSISVISQMLAIRCIQGCTNQSASCNGHMQRTVVAIYIVGFHVFTDHPLTSTSYISAHSSTGFPCPQIL